MTIFGEYSRISSTDRNARKLDLDYEINFFGMVVMKMYQIRSLTFLEKHFTFHVMNPWFSRMEIHPAPQRGCLQHDRRRRGGRGLARGRRQRASEPNRELRERPRARRWRW